MTTVGERVTAVCDEGPLGKRTMSLINVAHYLLCHTQNSI